MNTSKLGLTVAPDISDRYVAFYPCFQASPDSLTTVIDRSGKGNHALAGGSGIGASAWSNANCFTCATPASTGAYLQKAASESWVWSPSRRDSVVFSTRIYTPNTVASDTIFRTGTAASTGGWWLETNSTGFTGSAPGVRAKFYDTVGGTLDPVGYAALAANTWTTVGLLIDGPGNQAYLFVNGVLAPVSTSVNPRPLTDISTMTVQAAAVDQWIGAGPSGASDVKRFRGLHFAIVPESAGAIANPQALMRRLHTAPFTALSRSELP